MTTSDPPDGTELTDDNLDSLLRHVDDELLHHIQAAVDPAINLTAVMNIDAANAGSPKAEPAAAKASVQAVSEKRNHFRGWGGSGRHEPSAERGGADSRRPRGARRNRPS